MKKVCWLLIFVLVLGCFAGCQRKPEVYGETLTKRQKAKIEEALYEEHQFPINWLDDKDTGNVRYYGGYNGYAVLYVSSGAFEMPGLIVIGNRRFESRVLFYLLMYKDGMFIHLKDAYEQGIVGDDVIISVREKHLEAERLRYYGS